MRIHLDTNLLIALLWPSHERHELALKWFIRRRGQGWATCPFTQAGFVRIVSNPAFSRDAVHPREAVQVLSANTPQGPWVSASLPIITNGPNAIVNVPLTNQQQYFQLIGN